MADKTDPPKGEPKTFTQEQLDHEVGKRLDIERRKFADYDELKKKAERLDAVEEAKKTDDEKLEARIKAAEDKAAAAEKKAIESDERALRAEIASAKGLTAAQAKRLTGSTREELEADADDLLESFPASKDDEGDGRRRTSGGSGPASRPREDLRGGGNPTEEPVETNPAKLAETVPRY